MHQHLMSDFDFVSDSASHFEAQIQILLVEDNDINRQLMCDYLNHSGYQTIALADGSDFFHTLEKNQPHVILLDLKLGKMDGYQLLQQMQMQPGFQHIPVIIVSGLAFDSDRRRALDLGARRYFVKPVSLKYLERAIQEEVGCEQWL
jgi:CheY-like chemotaxis protein